MNRTSFPDYLVNLEQLNQRIASELDKLPNNSSKGDCFTKFVQTLLPQTKIGTSFKKLKRRERLSHDGGVDLIGYDENDNSILFVQCKLHVNDVKQIDSVLSDFMNLERSEGMDTWSEQTANSKQLNLLQNNQQAKHFLLVTLSSLERNLQTYENKNFGSKWFYNTHRSRIHFIDGNQILNTLRNAYSKLSQVPTDVAINLETPYIQMDNVYIGIVSRTELKRLYDQFGDALFFENVRDFLGIPKEERAGRTTPNLEIIKTIQEQPEKMLARNNGLVFGAKDVQSTGGKNNQLILKNGSVVNGCQTTMCLVEYADPKRESYVAIKIVKTSDAWDITKSANYQTAIPDVDLELARYLRPQVVKRVAQNLGVEVKDVNRSVFQLMDEIYGQKVVYSETRLLYIGLFSRTPNNVYGPNYTELDYKLIGALYRQVEQEKIFELLFNLQSISQEALDEAKDIYNNRQYSHLFERLYRSELESYKAFISILALCGTVEIDLSQREHSNDSEVERMKRFINESEGKLLDGNRFKEVYKQAVKVWMQYLTMKSDSDETRLQRDMYSIAKNAKFSTLYRSLLMEMDLKK